MPSTATGLEGAAAPSKPGNIDLRGSDRSPEITSPAPKKQALAEAKRDLIRQALFEDLDAVRLYVATALLLIEARDDFGTIYAIERGAAHYRSVVGAKKELVSLREGVQQ